MINIKERIQSGFITCIILSIIILLVGVIVFLIISFVYMDFHKFFSVFTIDGKFFRGIISGEIILFFLGFFMNIFEEQEE